MFPPSKNELEKVNEFTKIMNEMAALWPGMNNKSRYKKYYQYVERLPIHAMREIADTIFDNFRHQPLPKDFQEAASAWKKANEQFNKDEEFETNVNSCDDCADSGVNFVKVRITEPTVFMYCHCDFGKQCSQNHSYVLPVWNKSFDAMGFQRQTFDIDFFKPEFYGEVTPEKIQSTLDKFRDKLKSSRDYFEELPKRQQKGEISL